MIESLDNLTTAFSAEEFWPMENVASRPLKMSRQNASFFYFHDGNKNVTALTDEIGNLVQNSNYKTFGAVESFVSEENSDAVDSSMSLVNPFQFSSEYYDSELNLVYYNYRHYDPETGRFLSKDPIAERGGANLYNFVQNNPINRIDLLGLAGDGRNKNGKPESRETRKTKKINVKIVSRTDPSQNRTIIWEYEKKRDNGPSGHSDFEGYDHDFDWTDEDSGWSSPFNPFSLWRHFRNYDKSLIDDLNNAIKNCDLSDFNSYMHQLQDVAFHYDKGYRWWTLGHAFGGHAVDDEEAFEISKLRMKKYLDLWNKNCCKNKQGKWKKKISL